MGREGFRNTSTMDLTDMPDKIIIAPTVEVIKTFYAKEQREVICRRTLELD